MEVLVGDAAEEIVRPRQPALAPWQTLRAAPDVGRPRASRHDQHVAQDALVGEPFHGLLPLRHGSDLVDEEPPHPSLRGEHAHQAGDVPLQVRRVRQFVAVQDIGGTGPKVLDGLAQRQLHPRAFAVLPRTAHEDDARRLRQLVETERETELPRPRLELDDARPQVVAVDLAARQECVSRINVHSVNISNAVGVNSQASRCSNGAVKPRAVSRPRYYGSANAKYSDPEGGPMRPPPAAMATYCLPSTL